MLSRLFVAPRVDEREHERGRDARVEPASAGVRRERRVHEAAIPARRDEPGKQVRVGRADLRTVEQPEHRVLRPPPFQLERRVEVVRHRQVRIERQLPLERGTRLPISLRVLIGVQVRGVLRNHPVHPTEPGPGGGVIHVFLDTAQIEIAASFHSTEACAS